MIGALPAGVLLDTHTFLWFGQDAPELAEGCRRQGIEIMPIPIAAIHRMMSLPMHHKDPFDRLIAATALTSGLTLLSADAAFDAYGVPRVWG